MQMDSPSLPSQADLNSLYGSQNPLSYMRGYQNQDLADQFRQQAFTANDLTNQQAGTNIAVQQAKAPIDVASTEAATADTQARTGALDIQNQRSGLQLAQDQATQPDRIALLHSKLGSEMSDEELATNSNEYLKRYQNALLNNDVDGVKKYGVVLSALSGAVASKAADRVAEMQTASSRNASEERRTGTQVAGEENVERTRATSNESIANTKQVTAKYVSDQGKGLDGLARQISAAAQAETDPTKKAQLQAAAANAVNALARTRTYGGQLNLTDIAGIGREADIPTSQPSDEDLINKYTSPKK